MRIYYTLTLKDALVLSQSSATTNNHLCLDYISGSALLGALAARLYPDLTAEQSWQLFHSGACQFGPAYPLRDGEMALPVPAAWHSVKNSAQRHYYNLAATDFERDPTRQYQQYRDGFITANGVKVQPRQSLTTRTALDPATQRAKDSQLYSYAYLEPDQQFAGWIDADESLLALLAPHLTGELRLGRSRNGEFGRVNITTTSPESTPAVHNLGKRLVIWCLSDLELVDALGMPTLSPAPAMLHPDLQGTLDTTRSFIRTHKVRRFNRARQGFDSEQNLISKGSVLSFELNQPVPDTVLQTLAEQGAGLNRQQGLGWLSVNPDWAEQAEPGQAQLFSPLTLAQPQESHTPVPADTPLLSWIRHRMNCEQGAQDREQTVQALLHRILAAYRQARSYHHILPSYSAGPSASQWRRIAGVVRQHNHVEKCFPAIFEGESAICKASNDGFGWGMDWYDQKPITFASFTRQLLTDQQDQPLALATLRLLLERLCRYDLSTSEGLQQCEQAYGAGRTTR
jgi:CRISPR-associated protein Csx10